MKNATQVIKIIPTLVYACPRCNSMYFYKKYLVKHMKRKGGCFVQPISVIYDN